MQLDSALLKKTALSVINTEISALDEIKAFIDDNFVHACQVMADCQGKVIVIGMGKSGHICNKIAATLASTGTAAFFVHPAEASHGDLGMICKNDVVLLLSNSGETEEVLNLLPLLKRMGVTLISMTGNETSTLATRANIHISCKVKHEACPLGLAPTSSTTAALAMGDALAISLLEVKGFTIQDFAFSHPAGSLGRRLLLKVKDLMHTKEQLPIANHHITIIEALLIISEKGMGFTAVVNDEGKLLSVFTDGDLRRALDQKIDIHQTKLHQVIQQGCITTKPDTLAAEVLNIMEEKSINGIVAIDEQQKPIGAINMHDLLKAKVL